MKLNGDRYARAGRWIVLIGFALCSGTAVSDDWSVRLTRDQKILACQNAGWTSPLALVTCLKNVFGGKSASPQETTELQSPVIPAGSPPNLPPTMSPASLNEQKCAQKDGKDQVLSEGWKASVSLKYCPLSGLAYAELANVTSNKRVHIAGVSGNHFDGARDVKRPPILKGEVFQVIGRSREKFTYGSNPRRKEDFVYKVRFGERKPHEGWIHAYYLKQIQPDCVGEPHWEHGILACDQKPTAATSKGVNLWAKGPHWVARFGLLKGTSVKVIGTSLNKHWGKRFKKVLTDGGGVGWVPEDKVGSMSPVRRKMVPMFAGVPTNKAFGRWEVVPPKGAQTLQSYSFTFQDAGTVPKGERVFVVFRSVYPWWDGTTEREEPYVWIQSKSGGGWVREVGLKKYQPPPPPPPLPPACPPGTRKEDPVLVAKKLHVWYMTYLQKRSDKAKFFPADNKLNYAAAFCHIWEPHREHSDHDDDWIRKPLKIGEQDFFKLLRQDPSFKCLRNRWLHAGLSFYREALLQSLKETYLSMAGSELVRRARFPAYYEQTSSRCKGFMASVPGWAEKGTGYQSTWKDGVYDFVRKVGNVLNVLRKKIWWLLTEGCDWLVTKMGESKYNFIGRLLKQIYEPAYRCHVEAMKGFLCGIPSAIKQVGKLVSGIYKEATSSTCRSINILYATLCGIAKFFYKAGAKMVTCVRSLGASKTASLIWEKLWTAGCNYVGGLTRDFLLAVLSGGGVFPTVLMKWVTRIMNFLRLNKGLDWMSKTMLSLVSRIEKLGLKFATRFPRLAQTLQKIKGAHGAATPAGVLNYLRKLKGKPELAKTTEHLMNYINTVGTQDVQQKCK